MSNSSVLTARSIPVAKPYIGTEEEQATIDTLRSGWITQGPRVAEFETKFATYVGCSQAVAVSSCTTALYLSLVAAGIGVGDEVICPSLSFIATANSIAYTGATPVFADIDPRTYNLDPESVEKLITPRTRGILLVHQVGLPAELDTLSAIAEKHGLVLIEDAACAIGSEYKGERIGRAVGQMACFSFHPRKILTTGEGGMITTNDNELAARLRKLRQHAMSLSDVARHNSKQVATETYDEVGFNFRMTDIQAAIGMVQLARLDLILERRRYLASRYDEKLKDLGWLEVPYVPTNCLPNYQSYMIRMLDSSRERRDSLMQDLLEKGISTRRAVMAIHHEIPYRSNESGKHLPNTELVSDSGMILPLYHQMTEEDQDYVIDSICDFQ